MGYIIGKHSIWRQNQNIGRLQILSVMIEKIGNPVKCNGSFSASCRTLDYHDPVFCISNDGILLFLNGTNDVLKLDFSITSQFCFQDLIINFYITFKFIDHFSVADLVLPFGSNLAMDFTHGSLIRSRSFVIVIKQTAYRSTPVVY